MDKDRAVHQGEEQFTRLRTEQFIRERMVIILCTAVEIDQISLARSMLHLKYLGV